MNERQSILEIFENNKSFLDEKISFGIEKYRKGDVEIIITDKNGNALPNINIKINQKSHEFKFGANLFMLEEFESEEKNELYKKYFSDIFNIATLPFYWNSTEPEKGQLRYDKDSAKMYRRPTIDLCMDFCQKHGIEPREHALAYERTFPKWIYDANTKDLKEALEERYKQIASRYADKISTIEVTNEMFWDEGRTSFYKDPKYVEWCFKLAEKYFPNNQLVINEFTEACWKDACDETNGYYTYIKKALENGARIDAIGMQYHMFYKAEEEAERTKELYNPINIYEHMNFYSKLEKPLQVTEITVPAYSSDMADEEIQAEIIENLYSLWFSHPNMEQIIYWNLVDGYAYVENPTSESIKKSQGNMTIGENYYYGGLIRFDMTPKPAYYRIKNLITKKWHTEENVQADKNGKISFRGFFGDYEIEILRNGKIVKKAITISSKGKNTIHLEI